MADYQTKDEPVKKRKIRKADWQTLEEYLKKELHKRKTNEFRLSHERKWKEIDRQIAMEPMKKYLPGGKEAPPTWQSAFELGELSKASEVITADVMRLIFPASRTWVEAHVKPPKTVDPQTGKSAVAVDQVKQKKADAVVRALMTQQHEDFGLRARVEISVKEALHHGSFVASVDWESQNKVYDGQGLESLEAPVWTPNSMWNCYPDSSPSVIPGANIFYTGSMMIVSYMPRYKVLALKGDGYMNIDPNKIPKKNPNKDVKEEDTEIVTYYGDLVIERDDGDIYLPNSKCKTANGKIIYYAPNPLPFAEVIYQGYERQDVRDPYFTSPIEKNSPMQKLTTILANQFIDGVALHISPPGSYDGNDAYLVAQGGPAIYPGAMTATKGSNKVSFMEVGDPKAALMGVQFGLQKIEEGTSVNAIRSGASESDRKTATEVNNTQQGSEIRTVDFVGKMEKGGLRPFLYMQHELNLKKLKSYSFYCPEKRLPDFLTITKAELPKVVHFEVVGSKGVLGEQRRSQQMTTVTAFAATTPGFAEILNHADILVDMYEDAGVKGAESYVKTEKPQIPPEAQAQMQQMQQAMQELQQKLQESESGNQAKMLEIQAKAKQAQQEFGLEMQKAKAENDLEKRKVMEDAAFARWEAHLQAVTQIAVAKIAAQAKPKDTKKAA